MRDPIHPGDEPAGPWSREFRAWLLVGAILAALAAFLCALSPRFDPSRGHADPPILLFVSVLAGAGAVYFFWMRRAGPGPMDRRLLAWIVGIGLFARLVMFLSTPVLEDDHHRYLWDGGVTAAGFNPYRYAPKALLDPAGDDVPQALKDLAEEARPVLQGVNHPRLRTIYPPLTQAAFALAHHIAPWSLTAWRAVLLAVDLVFLVLLHRCLVAFGYPLKGLALYWWNPLVIKEFYNSAHMDLLLFPFLLGALVLTLRQRFVLGAGILGVAAGIKIWPALLLPVVLRPLLRHPVRLALGVLAFAGIAGAALLPAALTGLGASSGISAYASYWEMNDALFMAVRWIVREAMDGLGVVGVSVPLAARWVTAGILGAVVLFAVRTEHRDADDLAFRFLLATGALFLLSPTQFPWYGLWLMPFLALRPQSPLLLLTVLLPVYYLRFLFEDLGRVGVFDRWVVWLEFGPVLALLALETLRERFGVNLRPKEGRP